MAAHHEHSAIFEPFIQSGGADGQFGKPEPEEDGSFGFVDAEGDVAGEGFFEGLGGEFGMFPVEGADDAVREFQDFSGVDERADQDLSEAAVGQTDNGVPGRKRADDVFVRHDDSGADGRKAEFGEAHAQDDVFVPIGVDVFEEDVREGGSVGVVDDEGNVFFPGDAGEAGDFIVGQDVPGGIGGAGDAESGYVVFDVQVVETDAVFEVVLPCEFDFSGGG